MSQSVAYYNVHAQQFMDETLHLDMSALYDAFLPHLSENAHILDAGCGSGRDSREFLVRNYRVTAFDASEKLATLASAAICHPVAVRTFDQVSEYQAYDGIWACASLLHLPQQQIPQALATLWQALKPGGVLYVSFKRGEGQREHNGRHFTDATEEQLQSWADALQRLEKITIWQTADRRPGRDEHWLNGVFDKSPKQSDKLITGGKHRHFLPHLCASINKSSEIDMAVAFVKATGLKLLVPDLQGALGREELPARVRVLTSDYMDITDPEALRSLMLLQEQGAQVRVFQSAGTSFHLKAYIFTYVGHDKSRHGTAFIGSSNISRQALQDGLEWNYRVDYPSDDGFFEALSRFEELFRHDNTVPLSDGWIDEYEARRVLPPTPTEAGSHEVEEPPAPTPVQTAALVALKETRAEGYSRGLVVLATGLGKTWLSAFDAAQMGARRVLFVAHREEILHQAAETFIRIRPKSRVGFYMGKQRDMAVDVLCASVQTLGKNAHLERFSPQHFDYIVVDEFHHAAAPTYCRLLSYFAPTFMLGLTATPDRTDRSDILSLCDDNLVYAHNLFEGIRSKLLAPFHYYGIYDDSVDYAEIPWRNGKFDPSQLAHKLATLGRARHAERVWEKHGQQRTLAFCVSINHADFMAEQFQKRGFSAAAVHGRSELSRGEALEQLRSGELVILFSVDLFNEGVDLPTIDTVMLLRPTESKILFLQQLGRGLRRAEGKDKLVVLDFIGNHQGFLHKPQALMGADMNHRQLAQYARKAASQKLDLPDGCFINYDLQLIDFLKSLDGEGTEKDYCLLRDTLGRRPTLTEFYRFGANLSQLRKQFGHWFALVAHMDDLDETESKLVEQQSAFLTELEKTPMSKSFKMVLLEAFQELDGWRNPPELSALASQSLKVLQRRRSLLGELPEAMRESPDQKTWQAYWQRNPVKAWVGGNTKTAGSFKIADGYFAAAITLASDQIDTFTALVQELVDYRLASYEARGNIEPVDHNVSVLPNSELARTGLPFFPTLKIACGHFRTSLVEAEEYRHLGEGYGQLNPNRHFIAQASGDSMNGGKNPIRDGDYLLLEQVSPNQAGSITGKTLAIERMDEAGDTQYLLRVIEKTAQGQYVLKAKNPSYDDILVTDELSEQFRTFARLESVIDPLELAVGQDFMREDIAGLFGAEFNRGSWNVGHVFLADASAHVLLVTLNKQGKADNHRYMDHWLGEQRFHWQSQDKTTPESKRGRELINHQELGLTIHLFVRENRLLNKQAAPFTYYGKVGYQSHEGSSPMSVILKRV
ncbi:Methyltransferase domain-containing protein [Marinobacter sp. LV10R510-11A]|uniref:DUF3427 domain-containing protein n=1 Tax=Marinobacter sp. LV10R510-11A TaxID=1415568 RepID=UPI000BB83AD2|nr:DUF3427 domain-containing protein [Marinobacter sp. LV10R510-11A]SOB77237.1 Methyltransferase domain-containing protein [Marinobacter sp. LV10R510-11A]